MFIIFVSGVGVVEGAVTGMTKCTTSSTSLLPLATDMGRKAGVTMTIATSRVEARWCLTHPSDLLSQVREREKEREREGGRKNRMFYV